MAGSSLQIRTSRYRPRLFSSTPCATMQRSSSTPRATMQSFQTALSRTSPSIVLRSPIVERTARPRADAGEAVGKHAEDTRGEAMCAGEHERLAVALAESGDLAVVAPDRREAIAGGRVAEEQRRQRVLFPPRVPQRGVVGKLYRIAVD